MRARELLPACFLVFTALLVWPLLSIPNRPALIAGVPALTFSASQRATFSTSPRGTKSGRGSGRPRRRLARSATLRR